MFFCLTAIASPLACSMLRSDTSSHVRPRKRPVGRLGTGLGSESNTEPLEVPACLPACPEPFLHNPGLLMTLFGTSDNLRDKVLGPWDTVLPLTLSQPGQEGVGRDQTRQRIWEPGCLALVHSAHKGS